MRRARRAKASAHHAPTENRSADLPLDALLRGRLAVHRDGANAARARTVRHEPGVELPGSRGGEAEQQVELTLGDALRAVDALVGDDEMAVARRHPGEGALRGERVEELRGAGARTAPGRRAVVLEQHPARALLDARGDIESEPPRREVAPVGSAVAIARERARP